MNLFGLDRCQVVDGLVGRSVLNQRVCVSANSRALYRYALVVAGDRHDAWDLVNEALARMAARWSTIDAGGNPAA